MFVPTMIRDKFAYVMERDSPIEFNILRKSVYCNMNEPNFKDPFKDHSTLGQYFKVPFIYFNGFNPCNMQGTDSFMKVIYDNGSLVATLDLSNVISLNLYDMEHITCVDLHAIRNVPIINLCRTNIDDIDEVSFLTGVKILDLSYSQLSEEINKLNVVNLTSLQVIYWYGDQYNEYSVVSENSIDHLKIHHGCSLDIDTINRLKLTF